MKKVFNKFNHLMICAVLLFTLAFTFSGCSENETVQLSIPIKELLYEITGSTTPSETTDSGLFDVNVTLSGAYTMEKRETGTFSELTDIPFLFTSLTEGDTVTVTVSITFTTEDEQTIEYFTGSATVTLETGENTLNITLKRNKTDTSAETLFFKEPAVICTGGNAYNSSSELITDTTTDNTISFYIEGENGLTFTLSNADDYAGFGNAVYSWQINGVGILNGGTYFTLNSESFMYDITKGDNFKLNLEKNEKNILTLTVTIGTVVRKSTAIYFYTRDYTI